MEVDNWCFHPISNTATHTHTQALHMHLPTMQNGHQKQLNKRKFTKELDIYFSHTFKLKRIHVDNSPIEIVCSNPFSLDPSWDKAEYCNWMVEHCELSYYLVLDSWRAFAEAKLARLEVAGNQWNPSVDSYFHQDCCCLAANQSAYHPDLFE